MLQNKMLLTVIILSMMSLFIVLSANADIINTSVSTGMEIDYGFPFVIEASATNSDSTSASVNITGPVTGATAASSLSFNSLMSHSVVLNFDLSMNANGSTNVSEITGLFNNIVNNFANIDYFASSKEILKVSYDFRISLRSSSLMSQAHFLVSTVR